MRREIQYNLAIAVRFVSEHFAIGNEAIRSRGSRTWS